MSENSTAPILELKGISKRFGAVQALTKVDFRAIPGEVMALVGDNGAGKSTLIKGIAGIYPLDEGEVFFEGQPCRIHSPREAAALGIEIVYQDLALADNLDVVANMFLGRERVNRFRRLDEAVMEHQCIDTLTGLAVSTLRSVRVPISALSGGQGSRSPARRHVEQQRRILDEPTAASRGAKTVSVDLVRRLADKALAPSKPFSQSV